MYCLLPPGLQFPADGQGKRSTALAGKAILAAALRGAGTEEGDRLARGVEAEDDWRFRYSDHFMKMIRYSLTQ
jgi:hypothetical protein